ncbi:MAG: multiple sugar transport system permease protein [Thermotogaceae bacterium]|jgi:multiple sugar transport system permease protein|nr:multiple sugar transport system permease protein [Thermotogaceae bacterium]
MRKLELKWGIILALPAILGFLIWNLGPMIAAFVIGFTDWSIAGTPNFVGLANYKEIFFEDFIAKKSIFVTFYFAIGSVVVSMITAFLTALLLNQKVRALPLFRTIFFLPSIVPAIANAVVWLWLFNPDFGLLNYILEVFGLSKLQWIYDEHQVIPSLILMSAWGMGYTMMIFLAGLQGIPQQLYEAVAIDGGNWWHKFRHVTIPMMTPTIFFNLVMGLISSFQAFAQPFLMTEGGPNYASMFYCYYIYKNAFDYGRMGYASALSTILFLIILVLTFLIFKTSSYWVYYEGGRSR